MIVELFMENIEDFLGKRAVTKVVVVKIYFCISAIGSAILIRLYGGTGNDKRV